MFLEKLFRRKERTARIEFRDGRSARVLVGVKKVKHEGALVTVKTRDEAFVWHEAEVRMLHLSSRPVRTEIKKEASF